MYLYGITSCRHLCPLGSSCRRPCELPPAASVPGRGWSAREGMPRAGHGFQAQGGAWKWPVLRLLTGDWSEHPGDTFSLGLGGQETMSTRPELLHVGVFAIFAKADIAFVRSGFGYHDRRSLIGKPGPVELRGRQGHRWSRHVVVLPPSSSLSLPGGWFLLRGTAAGGKETNAAQNREQGGTPAQVESRAQLVPGERKR